MWTSIVFCALLALVRSQTTDVVQCTRNEGDLPINVFVSGCPSPQSVCTLVQGETTFVDIVFRAPRTMRSMSTKATAYLLNSWIAPGINYDLQENTNTCNYLLNSYCPVIEGEVLMYQLQMPILDSFPASDLNIYIEFRIEDENERPVVCLRATIRIALPSQTSRGKLSAHPEGFNGNQTIMAVH